MVGHARSEPEHFSDMPSVFSGAAAEVDLLDRAWFNPGGRNNSPGSFVGRSANGKAHVLNEVANTGSTPVRSTILPRWPARLSGFLFLNGSVIGGLCQANATTRKTPRGERVAYRAPETGPKLPEGHLKGDARGSKGVTLGSKKQNGPACQEWQGKRSLSPRNRAL